MARLCDGDGAASRRGDSGAIVTLNLYCVFCMWVFLMLLSHN